MKYLSGAQYYLSGVRDVTGGKSDLAVPVITPAFDGFVVAYTTCSTLSDGSLDGSLIRPYWVHRISSSGTPDAWTALHFQNIVATGGVQLRMCSIASQDENHGSNNIERFHFAYEADYPGGKSAIRYRYYDHVFAPEGEVFDRSAAVIVSENYPSCVHHHPNVAIGPAPTSGHGLPIVAWEVTDFLQYDSKHDDHGGGATMPMSSPGVGTVNVPVLGTKVIVRQMMTPGTPLHTPTWYPFFSFHRVLNNLPQPVVRVLNNGINLYSPPWIEGVIYQDTLLRQEWISRWGSGAWKTRRLKEYAQQGSLSLPYKIDLFQDYGSISYRGVYSDEQGLYSSKLVGVPSPGNIAEMDVKADGFEHFSVVNPYTCVPPITGGFGGLLVSYVNQNQLVDSVSYNYVPWTHRQIGGFSEESLDDSTSTLVEEGWPETEDSIRTEYFNSVDTMTIDMSRLLQVDTSQLHDILVPNGGFVSYRVVIKDSASGQVVHVLDSARIALSLLGGGNYSGVDPSDSSMHGMYHHVLDTISPTTSGKAYATIIFTKDNLSPGQLVQDLQLGGVMEPPPIPEVDEDSVALKQSQPPPSAQKPVERTGLALHIYPNPAKNSTRICVEELTEGLQTIIEVVNQEGNQVAILYNEIPPSDLGFCMTFNTSTLPSGNYYVRVQNSVMGRAAKLQVMH